MCCKYTIEYYYALKIRDLTYAATWRMNLDDIIESKISQSHAQKNTVMIPLI